MYFGNYRLQKRRLDKSFKKSRFRRPFNKRHGKLPKTLWKSESQYHYHIY